MADLLSFDEAAKFVSELTYRGEYRFRAEGTPAHFLRTGDDPKERMFLFVTLIFTDVNDPAKKVVQTGRAVVDIPCPRELLHGLIREQLRILELHEVDEWLRHDGRLLRDPHDGVAANEIV